MSTAALIQLFISLVAQRAEAGFPLLKQFLERWGKTLQAEANENAQTITFGAAPADLKETLKKALEELREKTSKIGVKLLITTLIALINPLGDRLWDSMFQSNLVPAPAPVSSTAPLTEAFDDVEEALNCMI